MAIDNKHQAAEISDWINFLIHIRSIGYTLIGLLISILFIVFGYLTIYINDLNQSNINMLIIFSAFLIIVLFYLLYVKSSPLKRANKLLESIMKGELTDKNEINKLWYVWRDNLYKNIKNFIKNHWIEIIGFIIIITGITLILLFCNDKNFCDYGNILITIGIGVFAIGIGISSDKKLSESQFIEFRRLRGQFEDIRLSLRERRLLLEPPKRIESNEKVDKIRKEKVKEFGIRYSFSIWKCKTYLNEINTIKKRLNDKDQSNVIRLLALYYLELLYGRVFFLVETGKLFQIDDNYKNQLKSMFNIVTKFDYYKLIEDKKLGKGLSEAKDMIINDVIDTERINKLNL